MVQTKSGTIFSVLPSLLAERIKQAADIKKINDLLEKLLIQGEKTRKDNNRREEQSKKDASDSSTHAQSPNQSSRLSHTQIGINTHTRTAAAKDESDRQMVNDLVKKSNRRIISISSSFPWNLFPDTIHVEESRVTFSFKQFLTSQSHSVDIKDISNVFLESSLFYSTLQVVSRTFIQNDIRIGNLNKKKAKKVQEVIEGLRTFAGQNINTSSYEIDELIAKIEEFRTDSTSS